MSFIGFACEGSISFNGFASVSRPRLKAGIDSRPRLKLGAGGAGDAVIISLMNSVPGMVRLNKLVPIGRATELLPTEMGEMADAGGTAILPTAGGIKRGDASRLLRGFTVRERHVWDGTGDLAAMSMLGTEYRRMPGSVGFTASFKDISSTSSQAANTGLLDEPSACCTCGSAVCDRRTCIANGVLGGHGDDASPPRSRGDAVFESDFTTADRSVSGR